MKVIIQAGGLGTRMLSLTENKPKTLIPVSNKPILFNIFDQFRSQADGFIVIGDYKYEVLDRYLLTFAKNENYILIHSTTKGNVSGIKKALSLISDNEPIMLIWSDIIPPKDFVYDKDFSGCQIGVSDFACQWSVQNNKLVHEKSDKNGVIGLYIFDKKSRLGTLPEEGSFTTWLSEQSFPIKALKIDNCIDIGTFSSYQKLDTNIDRCRPYNHIEIKGNYVIKTGLTDEAKTFIKREVSWYKLALGLGFKNIPSLINEAPMTISRIRGKNIFLSNLDEHGKELSLNRMIDALCHLHSLAKSDANSWDLYTEYFTKTINRLVSISYAIPFSDKEYIYINGKKCINVLMKQSELREAVLNTLMETHYTLYHGDCQLTNTMLDETGNIYFIDPRGYFGKTKNLGDVRYDWAKVYYAINGNFDQFNVKNFTLHIEEDKVEYSIGSGQWEFLTSNLLDRIPNGEGTEKEIKLIHAIIWLSLASHAWEDFDSMCVAYYNGLRLFNDWLEEYN